MIRFYVAVGIDAGRDHSYRQGFRPRSHRGLPQELVAGDYYVGSANGLRETSGANPRDDSTGVVRVATVNSVVKIEDQTPRESPEDFDLPRRQKTTLNNYRVESAEPPKLSHPRAPPTRYYLDLKRTGVGAKCRPE